MATWGLCSLTAVGREEVVIGEFDPVEYKLGFEAAQKAFGKRISGLLKREDLRIVRLIRSEPARTTFGLLRRRSVLSKVIYSCPKCSSGEAVGIDEMDWKRFQAGGGLITLVGNLELTNAPV